MSCSVDLRIDMGIPEKRLRSDWGESNLKKIVSSGHTGGDRGALDEALAAGFPCGGCLICNYAD